MISPTPSGIAQVWAEITRSETPHLASHSAGCKVDAVQEGGSVAIPAFLYRYPCLGGVGQKQSRLGKPAAFSGRNSPKGAESKPIPNGSGPFLTFQQETLRCAVLHSGLFSSVFSGLPPVGTRLENKLCWGLVRAPRARLSLMVTRLQARLSARLRMSRIAGKILRAAKPKLNTSLCAENLFLDHRSLTRFGGHSYVNRGTCCGT